MYDDFARNSHHPSYLNSMQGEGTTHESHETLEFDLMIPTHARAFLMACLLVQDLLGQNEVMDVQDCSDAMAIDRALEVYKKLKTQQEWETPPTLH